MTHDTQSRDTQGEPRQGDGSTSRAKLVLLLIVLTATVLAIVLFRDSLTLAALAEKESQLRQLQMRLPWLVFGLAFGIYALVTGFSIPGATALTLVFGWYFGWLHGVMLVSLASTTGATLSFLLSRYFFSDLVQRRFGSRLEGFNRRLRDEGAFYLFTLRLIPAVPFFVINLVMGLTPMRTWTYWWVSQLGMLPATIVYVYAGSRVPNLNVLAQEGIKSVFSPSQLLQITVAFALLGLFPLSIKWLLRSVSSRRPQ